ncbi:DUF1668 domain-containing protein [Botrimarina sp.]|uniref:DUF1668 domain-containing protein n=1 Tax=Botrimarina sp. TaxID=2795802 RepID=UPI0032EF1D06
MSRCLLTVIALAASAHAWAHAPWLYVTDDATPRLHFGEGLADRDYHLPEAIAAAQVWQDAIDAPAKRVAMEPLETDGFVGLEADEAIEPRGVLRAAITYGLYNGTKLVYSAQHFPAENPEAWPAEPQGQTGLAATLRVEGEKLAVRVLMDGAGLSDQEVMLTGEAGGEGVTATTDEEGVARFPMAAVHDGLNGLTTMRVDPSASGEYDGARYTSSTSVLTATFNYDPEAARAVSALPPVPEAVASFGAVVLDGWLYVYGGHIGQAHDHSRDNLSNHFRRIRVDGTGGWEELPMATPLQGLPLVAHNGKVYRVGGLHARNAAGEEEALYSVEEFAVYDPQTRQWSGLPGLPSPRSSHNAVVVGDTLYVVGGWTLSGASDGEWLGSALAYDLGGSEGQWRELPESPFKRRALALSHVDGRVAVLCGMTDDGDLSKQVYFYDPATSSWSEGPAFPGQAFHGFGLSAWNLDATLYAGGMGGVLYRLGEDRQSWSEVAEFATRRFFHQLTPDGRGNLLAVAGASPDLGHTGSIERLVVSPSSN